MFNGVSGMRQDRNQAKSGHWGQEGSTECSKNTVPSLLAQIVIIGKEPSSDFWNPLTQYQ